MIDNAMKQTSKILHIGGNAALMAENFSKEGFSVILTGATGPTAKKLLTSDKIKFIGSSNDEIHLIMEYQKEKEFDGVKTIRSNRFIATRDFTNSEFQVLDEFHDSIQKEKPNLIILSGN